MTTYYCYSGAEGTPDGTSWTNAWTTLETAIETASAAASGPHTLLVDSRHSESLSADTTITLAGNLYVLCVNSGTGALATGAVVGAQADSYSITIAGAYILYCYGMTFRLPGSSSSKFLRVSNTDGSSCIIENCTFNISGSGSGSYIGLGANSINTYVAANSCSFLFGATSQNLVLRGFTEIVGGSCASSGSVPTALISMGSTAFAKITGTDLSAVTTTLVANNTGGPSATEFANCKLGSGVAIKAAAGTVLDKGNASVWAYNCDAGDNHYAFYHGDAFGETTVSTSVYANTGAAYDGTNKCSWKIVTTANCNYYYPYVSPWMDVYHSGTSAISPYLEILRSGSTTKYQDDEVWGEFSYQGTSGSTKATIVNDRMTPLGTAADQTASSLGASDWTGEDATNNAYMKLEAGSITPAEIGHLRARVCVGEPSITVYVDPTIRGRT